MRSYTAIKVHWSDAAGGLLFIRAAQLHTAILNYYYDDDDDDDFERREAVRSAQFKFKRKVNN